MANSTPIVSIEDGKLKGTLGKNLDGNNFYQFFGIPYAKPPIHDLRFKPPQPAEPWNDVRDATVVGHASLSRDDITGEIIGSEDCLYLNVYTKDLPNPQSKLKPVMVFIHGGAFTSGSSRPGLYGPEFLMIKDIVLVTLNYRLGVLGFLAFDDASLGVTGNMGLKDQTLALKWVQKNIAAFNGDPRNVTIFGESAGSGSVHGHILSPASKGLFHKAILQSGCALNSWFWGEKNNARKILKQLGKTANSEKEALDTLMGLSGSEIYNAQEKVLDYFYPSFRRPFAAVIETTHESAFISKSPVEIMKEGTYNKVPMILGYTETEGMFIDMEMISLKKAAGNCPDFDLEDAIPYELSVDKGSDESRQIRSTLIEIYGNSSTPYNELTDGYFLAGIIETIKCFMKTSAYSIYLYRMSLAGKLNFFKARMQKLDLPGVCHGDELGYLFHSDITPKIELGSQEDNSIRIFVDLWTSFAIQGNPTPDNKLDILWKPVENEYKIKVLDIGVKLEFKDIPEMKRLNIWRDILKKYPYVRF